MNEFKALGLSDKTIAAIEKKGFKTPSPIQALTIPVLLKGEKDVIGKAQTGTGKTACFGLPILENLQDVNHVQAIILAPTRELALQVSAEIKSLAGDEKVRITTIYGGASVRDQMSDLRRGVDIVVGTPGRVIDLINRGNLDISKVSYAVLDEADEMLNMGFVEDIEEILGRTPEEKKMLLFSATMPREIQRIAKRFMREYELIEVESESLATDLIDQMYIDIMGRDRYAAIQRIIAVTPDFHGLIFCKTRNDVDQLSHKLIGDKYQAAALHGEVSQSQRENFLNQFKAKKINILVATDVAARGIDVNDLNVVMNYSLPQSPEIYVHRIGRTGRAGNKGTAITFVMPSEKGKLKGVERVIGQKIPKGVLPSVDDILAVKKAQIETTIDSILKTDKPNAYSEIATKLVAEHDPAKVVSAVLKYAFTNQLNSNSYKEIGPVTASSGGSRGGDRRGGSRGRDSRGGRGFGGRSRDSGSRGRSDGRSSYGGRSRDSGSGSSRSYSRNNDSPRSDRSEGGSRDSGSRGRSSEGRSFERRRDSDGSSSRDSGSRGGYSGRDSSRSSSRDSGSRGSFASRDSGRSGSRDSGSRGGFSGRDSGRSGSRDSGRQSSEGRSSGRPSTYGGRDRRDSSSDSRSGSRSSGGSYSRRS